jgi:hypothetical protein
VSPLVAAVFAGLPVFFSGLIFSQTFRDVQVPTEGLGVNLMGAGSRRSFTELRDDWWHSDFGSAGDCHLRWIGSCTSLEERRTSNGNLNLLQEPSLDLEIISARCLCVLSAKLTKESIEHRLPRRSRQSV